MHEHDQDEGPILSTQGTGDTFENVMQRYISRRDLLKGAVATSAMLVIGDTALNTAPAHAQAGPARLAFTPIQPDANTVAAEKVAPGNRITPLLRWGDPLTADAPEFDQNKQSAAAQEKQFGYNCDFIGFMPLPAGSTSSNAGLLVVNHEYTNPELMFSGYDIKDAKPTQEQVDIELAAHGVSVVEINKGANGQWTYNRGSRYNRRLTATTPLDVSGPAAGADLLKTSADPTGKKISGTLNNCAAGKTPWGTVLTAEENFHQYFANLDALPDSNPAKAIHKRYGLPGKNSERKWENFHARFDITKEPNEPFRHGWVVEVDPYDPTFTPVKRTALGRTKHEAATSVISRNDRVVLYMGDDERFEYVYKFVTAKPYNKNDRKANFGLLDEGTLYVAKFNDDGTGEWLPLVHGQSGLTEANGFKSQADVLINNRGAADRLGATKMDRPEDIETNPVNGKVYMVMTNNTQRATEGRAGTDKANPRKENRHGHIVEVTEQGNDHTATRFTWSIFMLCGDPTDASTFFAGYDKSKVSPISSPDNIAFDLDGNLWIATDGQPGALKLNDGFFACPVEGPERGYLRQFYSTVTGAEVCGPEFTADNTSLFLAIQHPAEGSTFDKPSTSWPDGKGTARPSVIVIQVENGGRIGAPVAAVAATGAQAPTALPATGSIPGVASSLAMAAGAAAAAAGLLIRFRERGKSTTDESKAHEEK